MNHSARSPARKWLFCLVLTLIGVAVFFLRPPSPSPEIAARLIAETDLLQPTDADGMDRIWRQRPKDLARHPQLAEELNQARNKWLGRSVKQLVEQLAEANLSEPHAFLARSQEMMVFAKRFPDVLRTCDAAAKKWAESQADAAIRDASHATDPLECSRALRSASERLAACGDFEVAQQKLVPHRRAAVVAAIDAARRKVRSFIAEDRYGQALSEATSLEAELLEESSVHNLAEDIRHFAESCAFLADLARLAGASQRP